MQDRIPEKAREYSAAHSRARKWRNIVAVLSCAVVLGTAYALTRPAITMSQKTFCGIEAHMHTDECYESVLTCPLDGMDEGEHEHTDECYQLRNVLVCGLEEDAEFGHVHIAACYDEDGTLICGQEETGHIHTDECYEARWELACPYSENGEPMHEHTEDCYERYLICEKEEHQHSLSCYSDPHADLESEAVWEQTIPSELGENWPENVAMVAKSQLGYTASTRNYLVDDDGSMHGYTRYGAWFGYPYGEWCAMFASFCLHYAGVPQTAFPYGSGCIYWTELLTQDGLYAPAADYVPKTGDFVFFDTDSDNLPDHVGVVTLAENGVLHTVEGNIANSVTARQHAMDESGLLGYGIVPESADAEDPAEPDAPLCGKEEHTHDDTCCDETGTLICGLEEHTHTESCYTQQPREPLCGKEEHTHSDVCYDESGTLICGLEEHIHTEDCYTQQPREPLCGKEEHTHSDACYDESGTLICGLEEHTHTESCYAQAGSTMEFTYADSELSMHVTVESPAPLAEGTELSVQPADDLQQARANMQDGAEQWIVRQVALTLDGETLDTSDMTMTADISVQQDVLAPLYSSLTEQAEDTPEADAGITLAVMQEDGTQELQELESVTIAPDEDVPVLHTEIQSGTLVLYASSANPEFTVQYYAEIPRFDTSGGDKNLTIFDTSGARLPTNGSENTTKSLYLDKTGNTTQKNAGEKTDEYIVATTPELTQMYTDNTFEYVSAPEPKYVDKLMDNEHYALKEIWVLKDGRDSASTNTDDWDVYTYSESIRFTNRQAAAAQDKNLIYIKPGKQTVLRLVYDAARADFTTPATFYDYDISSGMNSAGNYLTGITGINAESNYGTSTNGDRKWRSYQDVLAFGNANCGTGMGNYKFAGIYLNRHSGQNYGCAFGIAKSLQDGKIVYNDYIVAPKLFNDGDANGKHTYSGSSLTFQQVGDTYTLSSASVAGLGSITGLEKFFNPSPYANKVHDKIYTNDFWPLDAAREKTDPLFGSYSNPLYYQGYASADGISGSWTDESTTLPFSDDGQAHNSFFGMQYAVEFTLTPDYVGPLEYTFFGDDDMWVFLDNTLVCDIGGVHSSVGEYVNLWDYLDLEGRTETKTHTLTIFYTERGASGSTCYMNFTLPSVSGVTIKQTTGGLMVYKEVSGEADPEQEFTFRASFTRSDGNALTDDHTCYRYDANGVRIGQFNLHSGGSFQLKAGEHLEILNLPVGTSYSIVETPVDGYTTTHTVNGVVSTGTNATGIIVKDTLNEVVFTNTRGSVPLHLQKLDQDGNLLSGAVFQLRNAAGETINVFKNGDGSYSAVSSAADVIEPGKLYYITAAGEQSYVVGQNTSLSNFDAQLQKKTGADTQKLRVYQQTDGSYSFQSAANGKWLDLDAGGLTDGTLIHFWDNDYTPTKHDNQKWYLSVNSDGTFKIKPRVAVLKESNAVMDLSGGTLSEGQKIQAWAGNTSIAQKWLLIPVDPAQSPVVTTQELEVSATGELTVTGLLPGSYTLTETKVPEGFRDSLGTVSVRIGADGKVSLTKPNVFVEADDTGLLLKVTNQHEDIDLTLEKQVVHSDTTQDFPFTITYRDADGTDVTVASPKLSGGASSGPFTIPYGVTVTIREEKHDGFTLTFYNGATLLESSGDSCTFRMTENVTITAVNTAGYALPSTGGGVVWYQLTGLLLLMTAGLLYVSSLRRRRERGPQ